MKRTIAVLLAILMITSVFSMTVFAEDTEQQGEVVQQNEETVDQTEEETDSSDDADQPVISLVDGVYTITEDGNYTIDASVDAPVDIIGAKATVTLDNANIQASALGFARSAIKVSDGAEVTFVLSGFSNIAGSSTKESCGIEVEFGTSVTFKGEGTLNVTGGKYGAAIGSYGTGTNIPENERVKVGIIKINSGNINAYAGNRGSGIGAGYHVNGNVIIINGGVIHAYGKECGAGIGCGYGTSGGAIGVAAVGEYDSGQIVINGGEVYAATAWDQSFDYSDLSALNANDPGSFAAGIGGGYGASASDIEINGGKVVAIGSCGGAGIGGGRGTSNSAKYNQNAYRVNIRIGGDADVTAISATSRSNELNSGGAAIGSGRGTHYGGNIEISGNAKVTAICATGACAIGASKQPSPVDGSIPVAESVDIGDNVDLYAVTAGTYAVDKDADLYINDVYFGSSDRYFFGEDAVAISDVESVKVESTKGEMMYTAPVGSVSLWSRIKPQSNNEGETIKNTSLGIVTPLAMAVRFEDGGVYYSGDSVEVEVDKEYKFQMCSVDWSTRTENSENKIHKAYETFYPEATHSQHVNHGIYSDEGLGLCGTVVYTVCVSSDADRMSFDESTKTFIIPLKDCVLRTDVNKCFMAYIFTFENGDYNKQTGIDNVVYDTGVEHENTLEDFRYNKPLEYLSVNLPLGSTVTAKAYENYVYFAQADVFISIDEENPDLSYKTYVWPY